MLSQITSRIGVRDMVVSRWRRAFEADKAKTVASSGVLSDMKMSIKTARAGLTLLLISAISVANANPLIAIQIGSSYMDSYSTSTAFADVLFNKHQIGNSLFSWSPDASIGWIDGRDISRYRQNAYTTLDSIWIASAGARLSYGTPDDWYHSLFFSFQPAIHSGRTQALSSAYEFNSTLGWQGRRFSFQLRHISNGSLHEPNRGETMALVGVSFDP